MSRPIGEPALSVVVVAAGRFSGIRRTVAHLRRQTVRDRLELIVVASGETALEDADSAELDGFARVHRVFTGAAIRNVDTAAADGVHRATSPVVALIEDHAYPEPDWAEQIIAAQAAGEWGVVGTTMMNANPHGMWSWTNLLIAYGPWTLPAHPGEQDALPGHNVTYRRDLLLAYGDRLGEKLGRSGGLLQDLQDRGYRLYLSGARLAHANPSRLWPTITLRFNAGRLYGYLRARDEGWTPLHRVVYVLGGPLIPFVRFRRIRAELFGRGRRAQLVPRIWPWLFAGLVLDALGQMAGYALGPGRAPEVLAVFEMDRMRHLTARDRRLLQVEKGQRAKGEG